MSTYIILSTSFLILCVSHAAFLYIGWTFGVQIGSGVITPKIAKPTNSKPVHDGPDLYDEERLDYE